MAKWSEHDVNVLKNMYTDIDCSKEEIMNALETKRKWDSIKNKARKLGLTRLATYTKDDLVKILQAFYNEYNRSPRMKDFDGKNRKPRFTIFTGKFKTWNNALKEAGIPLNSNRDGNKHVDVESLRNDYKAGLTYKEIMEKYNISSIGSVGDILRGLDIDRRWNEWTEREIDLLKDNYPWASWDELFSIFPNTNKQRIIDKAYSLKIKRLVNYWSDEELNILKENYGIVEMNKVLQLLPKKTYSAIQTKARDLKLKYKERWSSEDEELLKKVYPTSTPNKLQEYFPDRSYISITCHATMVLNLNKDKDKYQSNLHDEIKKDLLSNLVGFARQLKRTPTIADINNMTDIGAVSYSRYFGSYSNACIEAGLPVNSSMNNLSYKHISKNGDICDSTPELSITNLLIDNDIEYEKGLLYKEIIDDPSVGMRRTDWVISGSVIVEYFGLMDKKRYAENAKFKMEIADSNGVKLIPIFPSDLKNKYKGLIDKFKQNDIDVEFHYDNDKAIV